MSLFMRILTRGNPITTSPRCLLGTTTFGKKPTVMVVDVRRSDAPVDATDIVLRSPDRIRAFYASDARCQRLGSVARIQGLPPHGRRRLKNNLVRLHQPMLLRLGTLNVGTMTGRSRVVRLPQATWHRHRLRARGEVDRLQGGRHR